MAVYLKDHPPKRSQFRNPRRSKPSGAIVIHTAENTGDVVLPDGGAEAVAKFISTRTDAGSYHSIVDSDSVVRVGEYSWEMYGEGTGGNRWALHLSFACKEKQWPSLPESWVRPAILNGAAEALAMAQWVKSTTGVLVPGKRISAAEYRAGKAGFISHAELDPGRRTDPGTQFPWGLFLGEFNRLQNPAPPPARIQEEPMADTSALEARLANVERMMDVVLDVLPYADSPFDLVTGLYHKILGREPDDQGLLYWVREIERGAKVGEVIRVFLDVHDKQGS